MNFHLTLLWIGLFFGRLMGNWFGVDWDVLWFYGFALLVVFLLEFVLFYISKKQGVLE